MQECSMKIRAGERWHLDNSVTFTLPQLPELMESLLLGKDPGRVWSTSDIEIEMQVIHVEESSVGVSNGKQLTPFISSEVHKKCILVHF